MGQRAADAVEETYAEIRRVVGSPVVTRVWALLAEEPRRLEATWRATRGSITSTPLPEELAEAARDAVPVTPSPIALARGRVEATLDAFDRTNACTLVALSALLEPRSPDGGAARRPIRRPPVGEGLLPRAAAPAVEDRAAHDRLAALVSGNSAAPGSPTLLAHLASIGGLLAALDASLSGLDEAAFAAAAAGLAARARAGAPPPAARVPASAISVADAFVGPISRALVFSGAVRRILAPA